MNKKNMKKDKKTGEKKSRKKKKEKRAQRGKKMIFHIRTVKRNRNEIEAQKKSDFEHPTKKMKENEK